MKHYPEKYWTYLHDTEKNGRKVVKSYILLYDDFSIWTVTFAFKHNFRIWKAALTELKFPTKTKTNKS